MAEELPPPAGGAMTHPPREKIEHNEIANNAFMVFVSTIYFVPCQGMNLFDGANSIKSPSERGNRMGKTRTCGDIAATFDFESVGISRKEEIFHDTATLNTVSPVFPG